MKTIKYGIIGAVALLLAPAVHTFAIEELKLSVQCSNVVLSWPSASNETYIVQYRPTLNAGVPWQTLTSSLPVRVGTNLTFYIHSNIVAYPNCGGGGSFAAMGGDAGGDDSLNMDSEPSVPMAMREDGTSAAVPLVLYPPGFDLSGFVIFDPVTAEWVKGSGYRISLISFDDPQPQEGETDYDPPPPDTGFYRVVRNGVHLFGITNGMTLSGVVTIPVEVGTEVGNLVALSVRENGSPAGNSPAIAPFEFPLHVVLDTTAMSNGVHQISGFASWNSGGDEDGGAGVDAESPPITVTVHNEITFPNWIEHFGELYDSLVILAQSAHAEAYWYIDVYGGNAGYIGTFGPGYTDNGLIEVAWNLIGPPPYYQSYANEPYFDFVITTEFADGLTAQGDGGGAQADGSASSALKRTYKQTDNWTSKGMWVVANQQAWEEELGSDMLDIATDGFVTMADGVGLTTRPSHPYGEAFRIGYGEGIPESTRNSQWAALRDALYHQESRNFFFLGHGSPNGIGASANTNRFICASENAARLHTIPAGQTNRHGYRFAFLFGCETASGTLPESFGIIHRENVPGIDFADAALTPGAFVGWNHKQSAGILGSTLLDNVNYLQHFQYEWSQGIGVHQALYNAKYNYSDVGFINFNKLKIFGNWDLTYWAFNR